MSDAATALYRFHFDREDDYPADEAEFWEGAVAVIVAAYKGEQRPDLLADVMGRLSRVEQWIENQTTARAVLAAEVSQ